MFSLKGLQAETNPKAFQRGHLVPCVHCLCTDRGECWKQLFAPASLAWRTLEGAGPITALYLSGGNVASEHVKHCDKCELSSVKGPLRRLSYCTTSSAVLHNEYKDKYIRYRVNCGGYTGKNLFSPPSRAPPLWCSNEVVKQPMLRSYSVDNHASYHYWKRDIYSFAQF